ncbi:MAG: JAB domain-containing protein [Acidobacteriota bacterium]
MPEIRTPAGSHPFRGALRRSAVPTRLQDTGRIIGIRLLDHIIIGRDGHFSFADEGLL